MTLRPGLSRRSVLVAVGTLGAGSGLWFLAGGPSIGRRPEDARLAALLDWLSDPSSARRAGRRVLAEIPEPVDPKSLLAALVSHPRWDSDRPAPELFAEQIREDFREGRVMRIDGWVLAETEARLLALAHLAP